MAQPSSYRPTKPTLAHNAAFQSLSRYSIRTDHTASTDRTGSLQKAAYNDPAALI